MNPASITVIVFGVLLGAACIADHVQSAKRRRATPPSERRYSCTIRFVGSSARNRDEMTSQLTPGDYAALVAAMGDRQPYTTPGGTLVATDKITRVIWNGPRYLLETSDGRTEQNDH